jgi:hypothetical protein
LSVPHGAAASSRSSTQDAIRRAGRLGLAHRDIASAAGAAAGTIRSLLTRPANGTPTATHDELPAQRRDDE